MTTSRNCHTHIHWQFLDWIDKSASSNMKWIDIVSIMKVTTACLVFVHVHNYIYTLWHHDLCRLAICYSEFLIICISIKLNSILLISFVLVKNISMIILDFIYSIVMQGCCDTKHTNTLSIENYFALGYYISFLDQSFLSIYLMHCSCEA